MSRRNSRISLALSLVIVLVAGMFVALRATDSINRVKVTAFFSNSNGIYVGDEVRVLGIPIGQIDAIEPLGQRVKITFSYADTYKVPADAKAVVLSPSLVAVRAIQLTPAYTDGAVMNDGSVIPQERTAVPVEWDDFRQQLQNITETLQPTTPGGVSTLGGLINTAADNLRGEGANVRQTLIQLSQAFSALGDHSDDLFSTVKNLSTVVTALQSSTDLMRQLNQSLAGVTTLLSNEPNEIGGAIAGVNDVVGDFSSFLADNRETVGTTSDKLAAVTTILNESLDDLKQTLHIAPTTFSNFANIFQPAQGALTGALALNNFSNPITFLCGAIQAASRLGAEQSAKLCVQYLAPIIKNRQLNFLPLGMNPLVGVSARPNEITYSEDWMRPDYIPPPESRPAPADTPPAASPPHLAAEAPLPPPAHAHPTNPADGLAGLMAPPGAGS